MAVEGDVTRDEQIANAQVSVAHAAQERVATIKGVVVPDDKTLEAASQASSHVQHTAPVA